MKFGRQADMLITQVVIFIVATIIGIGLWLLLKRFEQHIRIIILILLVVLGFISGCAFYTYLLFHIE